MFKIILSYITIYVVWSSTYLFIKLAVTTMPPMYVVGLRFFCGGLGLLAYCLIVSMYTGKKVSLRITQIGNAALIGILLLIGGNGLVTIAEKKVDSYIAALIISTTPIVVLLIDRIIFKKQANPVAICGVFVGVLGTCLLLNKGNSFFPEISLYDSIVLAGVVLWGIGTTLSKHVSLPEDVVLNAGLQSTVAGLITLVFWSFFQPPNTVTFASVSTISWISLAYLAIIGSVAFIAFGYLVKHEPNHRVVSYSLVNPPLAVLLGIFVGKEPAVPFLIPSIACILIGLILLMYGEKIRGVFINKKQE